MRRGDVTWHDTTTWCTIDVTWHEKRQKEVKLWDGPVTRRNAQGASWHDMTWYHMAWRLPAVLFFCTIRKPANATQQPLAAHYLTSLPVDLSIPLHSSFDLSHCRGPDVVFSSRGPQTLATGCLARPFTRALQTACIGLQAEMKERKGMLPGHPAKVWDRHHARGSNTRHYAIIRLCNVLYTCRKRLDTVFVLESDTLCRKIWYRQ